MLRVNNLNGFGANLRDSELLASPVFIDPSDLSSMWQEITGTSGTAAAVNSVVGSFRNKGVLGGIARAANTGTAQPILRQTGSFYYLETTVESLVTLDFASQTPSAIWWAHAMRLDSSSAFAGFGSWSTPGSGDDWNTLTHAVGSREFSGADINVTRTSGSGVGTAVQDGLFGANRVYCFNSNTTQNNSRVDLVSAVSTGATNPNFSVSRAHMLGRATSGGTDCFVGRSYGFVGRFAIPSESEETRMIQRLAARQGRAL